MSPAKIVSEWMGDSVAKRITLMAGACTATITAFLTVMHFGQVAEPYWIATRSFTRSLVEKVETAAQTRDEASTRRIVSTEIAIKEADRRSVESQMDRLEVEIRKLPPEQTSLRDLLSDQLTRYRQHRDNLGRELEELYRQQSGRRP